MPLASINIYTLKQIRTGQKGKSENRVKEKTGSAKQRINKKGNSSIGGIQKRSCEILKLAPSD